MERIKTIKSYKYYIFRVSVALAIQHAKRMRRIILSSAACLAVTYFSTPHKRHYFRQKLLNTKCILIFSTIAFV
jgi:hypothetical protein